jgi:hypothetical protein
LSPLEVAFIRVVKQHFAKLLEAKRIYRKHRNTTRWVKFGDENTNLFQTMATYSFRRNFISSLQLSDGSVVSTHDEMVGSLWLSYKDRLGVSEFSEMFYELSELIQSSNLSVLHDPFTMEEILALLTDMPSDHTLGPDGFNGAFIKKVLAYYQRLFCQVVQ